jgi:membrane protein DedA with SNARE-associated domain
VLRHLRSAEPAVLTAGGALLGLIPPVSRLEDFISQYGLVALGLLATVEGDLSVLVAGVLAHLGLLSLPGTILAGALGNLTGDCVWFTLGRRFREPIRSSRLYRAVGPRIERLAHRIGPWQLLAARVVWGTRSASMIFWGQHGLSAGRFLLLDGLGCLLGAATFTVLGYGVGQGTEALVGSVRRLELWLLVAVVGGAAVVWAIGWLTRKELGE